MNVLKKFLYESDKYGFYEAVCHVLFSVTHSERLKTQIYMQRDKYYKSLSEDQIRMELAEIYQRKMKYELNLMNPLTFTEKIQWLKINDNIKEKERLADKYLVRDWVEEKIGKGHLVPLLGVWDDFDSIDFNQLPDKFCLKMNHGSGMNYIVTDKAQMPIKEARKLFKAWEALPFYVSTLEFQYREIPRRIIAEKYIQELNGGLYDYKVHCFNGKPAFIQCIGDRDLEKHTGYQNNYDLEWKKLDWTFEDYPDFPYEVPRPKLLREMIEYAARLSEGFHYVRVDLYEMDDSVYLGEMTFTPASGLYPYKGRWTRSMDIELGRLLVLPKE